MNSYKELVHIGSGQLEIDATAATCTFYGASIEPISIAYEISAWLKEGLEKHKIALFEIESARLTADLTLETTKDSERQHGSFYIGKDGMPIEKGCFYNLEAKLKSAISTDEATYQKARIHYERWPVGWPDT